MFQTHNIGALIKQAFGVGPAANAAGAVNGAAIDRLGYGSCSIAAITGLDTGSPSARSATVKLQDSADGATGWNDISGAPTIAVTAVSSIGEAEVNLASAKRYIRAVTTTAFTAGSTPTLFSAVVVTLGGADKVPAA